jgi:uncharacterized repeat protein (TIGR01451 family)
MQPWLLALGALMLAAPPAAAQYEVAWWTVDGGGTANTAGGPYTLSGTVGQPDAGGPDAGGSYVLNSGFWALFAGGGGGGGPQADLSVTKTDGVGTVVPGAPISYTIVATNAGPAPVTGATVADTPPATLIGASWTCAPSSGATCTAGPVSGSINDSVILPVGASITYTLTATLSPSASGSLTNTATVTVPPGVIDLDPTDNLATDMDTIGVVQLTAQGEITHGMRLRADLAALPGPSADEDRYRISQGPYSSFEIVIDETSGDIGAGAGPLLERLAADGSTLLQSSVSAGVGPARSLRWENSTSSVVNDQIVRVKSASCGSNCDSNDTYRMRAYETTSTLARFNNSGSQFTVLFLQNPGVSIVSGHLYFWGAAGTLLATSNFSLGAHQLLVLNSAGVTGLAGQSGTITLSHDGRYGELAGKTVALELATGFSFDSPLEVKAR